MMKSKHARSLKEVEILGNRVVVGTAFVVRDFNTGEVVRTYTVGWIGKTMLKMRVAGQHNMIYSHRYDTSYIMKNGKLSFAHTCIELA